MPDDDPAHDSLFHVEQQFSYARPVRAGDVLRCRRRAARTWEKQGRRGGRLRFVEHVTEFVDGSGELVVTSTWLDVATERSHASITSEPVPSPSDRPATNAVAGSVLVENITRTQVVMYAGASGDFHPLHHDDVYARHRGYPGAFVPGMFTMATAGRAVTAVLPPARLATFGGRFMAQVWPGDTLYGDIRVTSRAGDLPTVVEVDVRNQRDVVVFAAHATAR